MSEVVERIRSVVDGGLPRDRRALLAVSGGLDSMVLLDAAAAVAADRIVGVATFDHGTGPAAREAVALVRAEGAARGLAVAAGATALAGATEADWRDARWRFLREAARSLRADVTATGHTRDDQVETVAMRVLRDAGPRGLAGLYAPSRDVVRPLLDLDRAAIAAYAAARGGVLRWAEDPSNRSLRHRRNRVRHELLPALRAARPAIDAELLAVAREASAWRADVERFVDEHVAFDWSPEGALVVATETVARYDPEGLAVLWPAIAARGGVRLDRRGTVRLVQFTIRVAAGATVAGAALQLSGGVDVEAGRGEIVLRRARARPVPAPPGPTPEVPLEGEGEVAIGGWRFRRGGDGVERKSPWSAYLPEDRSLVVRPWRAGDRMRVAAGRTARRVKRFLADAHVPARQRSGWPVVLADGEIVWIPGVRRSDAATDRPGQPGVHYLCERIDG